MKKPAPRLQELQRFLRALPQGLVIWFLSIGIDRLTTELLNLFIPFGNSGTAPASTMDVRMIGT